MPNKKQLKGEKIYSGSLSKKIELVNQSRKGVVQAASQSASVTSHILIILAELKVERTGSWDGL